MRYEYLRGRSAAWRWCAAALALILVSPSATLAQQPPLAEVARREQERRKTSKPPTKVLTTKDMPASAIRPPGTAPSAPAEGAASGEQGAGQTAAPDAQKPPDGAAGGGSDKDETYWRNRITQARETLRRSEAFLEALQSRVNALTSDFARRDDPYQRAKLGEDRKLALAEMDRVRMELAANRKLIEDIEEEARRAGVPPGWLR